MSEHRASFGELLRRHRTAAGLSQEALAERAGLSQRGIADLERGVRRSPYRDTVARLVQALELDAAQHKALVAASQRVRLHAPSPPARIGREPLTSFIGREHDLAEIRARLGRARLLTLAGTGGIGKTRLALEVAAKEAERFRDGVWLVELASLIEPALVPHQTAAALGIQDIGGRPLTDALVDYLRNRDALLVLDNCEHLVQACAELSDRLIRNCPSLRILATSREVLGVEGEATWLVPPLEGSEAARLFVERASASAQTFRVTPHNAADVARVCERLHGIPLALELAAARANVLSVAQIAERLDDALRLLTTGARLAPERQQTLRGTLAWSYALLSESEQLLFDRLSIFAAGWTLRAAELVCAGNGIDPAWVLDGVGRLFDKSLLLAEPSDTGPARYRLLEPVRQYAAERLNERGEHRSIADRHADFYIALAEEKSPEIHLASAIDAMDTLDREHDNVRVALRWLLSNGDVERAQRLAGAMSRFWLYRSHIAEGEAMLRRALDLPGGDAPSIHRLSCLSALPVFANTRGDLAALQQISGEELRLCRLLGERVQEAFALVHVAQAAALRGDLDDARQWYQAGLEAARDAGSTAAETLNLVGLANVAFEQGLDDDARALAEAALACASEEGWTRGRSQAYRILGQICHRQGDYARAWSLLEAGIAFSRRFGARWWTLGTLMHLGNLAVDAHKVNEVRDTLAEGLHLAHELGDWPSLVAGLNVAGRLAVALEQPLVAVRLFAAADALRRRRGLRPGASHEREVAQLRDACEPSVFEAASVAGASMSVDDAVEVALSL